MIKIESLADYEKYFGFGPSPLYKLNPAAQSASGEAQEKVDLEMNGQNYSITAIEGTSYLLYSSIQLFR